MMNFCFFGEEFHWDRMYYGTLKTVNNSTQCGLFIGEYKKYAVSGVTFSFKNKFPLIVAEPAEHHW